MSIAIIARLAVAALGLAALSARPTTAQVQAPPTFRSGVDLITIDVVVVDGDGRQIPILGVADFAVDVDGKPRAVLGVQYFEGAGPVVPVPRQGPSTEPMTVSTGPDVAANQVVLVFDVGATSPDSREQVVRAANAVIDRLPPGDRVATVAIPLQISELTFTANRQVTKDAIRDITGWSPRLGRQLPFGIVEALEMERRESLWERAVARECNREDEFMRDACRSGLESDARALVSEATGRAAASTTGLQSLLGALSRIEGPKTMLYFSEELATDGARVEVARVGRAAASARTRIHVMHAQPFTADAASTYIRFEPAKERQRQVEGLEYVSDWTGGDLFALGTSNEIATRLASELSGRYLLLVETAPTDRDGKPHTIRVRVPDRRFTVRARREFVTDNLRTVPPSSDAASADVPRPEPAAALAPAATGAPAADPVDEPAPLSGTTTRRGTVVVAVDPLHPDRRSDETAGLLRELSASLAARGFDPADRSTSAPVLVELAGQRVLGAGRTALPGQGRGGSSSTVLVRVTVTAGDRIIEIRGRNQSDRDPVKSAADETARLIDRWVGDSEAAGAAVGEVPPPASTVPPQELLPRMRAYVGAYEKALAGIVAEERYVQTFSQRIAPYPAPPRLTERTLRSEMGFAWFPAPGTWFGFRDVLEADGKPVPDRQQRLEQLFVDRRFPSAEQLARVAQSSARFNIGPARRNFNVPTIALLVGSPNTAGRFAFELRGYDVINGVRVALVAFSETGSPTLITRDGHDWPSRGLLWLEPDSGRIWRTDLQLADRDMEMRQTTWFAMDGRLDLLVPTRMRELYDYLERADTYVEAIADYSNVRRFRVSTSGGPGR